MFNQWVRPALKNTGTSHMVRQLLTFGVGESALEQRMTPLVGDDFQVGFLATPRGNSVKLRFESGTTMSRQDDVMERVVAALGTCVVGEEHTSLAAAIGAKLVANGHTLALAESCTAGGLAAWVASIPGASRYLLEGSVVYSNDAKVRTCGVAPAILEQHGAVSEPVARQLALGIRERAGSTWGIGITGIAGPGGGTPDKPVGTVHIAVDGPAGSHHRLLRVPGSRDRVTAYSAGAALDLLRRHMD